MAVKKKGFTLIELIVVIVILGILAAMSVPRFLDAHKRGYVSACKYNQHHVFQAAILYADENRVTVTEMSVKVLWEAGYLPQQLGRCIENKSSTYEDYTVIFLNGHPTDVRCNYKDAEHQWP